MEIAAVHQYPNIFNISHNNGILGKRFSLESSSHDKNQSDRVDLSPEGKDLSSRLSLVQSDKSQESPQNSVSPITQEELTAEELAVINKLQGRDAEVRAHEQAHLSAAGQYAAGGASFTYQVGPNGKKYAIGGEVPIDIGKESTPQETIAKMGKVKRAALAPANPSSADRRIAAQATVTESQARSEITSQMLANDTSNSSLPSSEDVAENKDTKENDYSNSDQNHTVVATPITRNSRQMILEAYRMSSNEGF